TPRARLAVLGGEGQGRSAAASIAAAASACYLQTVKARPGETYLCICWVKRGAAELHCGGKLTVRLRDERGGWHKRRDLEPSVTMVEAQPGWQPLAVLVTVPEGAGSLIVMPGASHQAEGAQAIFDNVALYRLPAN
ncbi:hypothetical protein HQ576_12995, partial [bacterium]|nr:hypothetical protein [bacterium]